MQDERSGEKHHGIDLQNRRSSSYSPTCPVDTKRRETICNTSRPTAVNKTRDKPNRLESSASARPRLRPAATTYNTPSYRNSSGRETRVDRGWIRTRSRHTRKTTLRFDQLEEERKNGCSFSKTAAAAAPKVRQGSGLIQYIHMYLIARKTSSTCHVGFRTPPR